jgi:hypothetical protein
MTQDGILVMADGCNPSDWTVLPSGQGTGSVSCGAYRGWYTKTSNGSIQIAWADMPENGPSIAAERTAREACARTDGDDPASKSGRLDAGG